MFTCVGTHVYVCRDSCMYIHVYSISAPRVLGGVPTHTVCWDTQCVPTYSVTQSHETVCLIKFTVFHTHVCRPDTRCHTFTRDCVSHGAHSVTHTCVSSRHTVSHSPMRLCVSWDSQCFTHMCVVPTHGGSSAAGLTHVCVMYEVTYLTYGV